MRPLTLALAATLALGAALPVLAGGPVVVPETPAPVPKPAPFVMPTGSDWTGASVGLDLGYSSNSYNDQTGGGLIYGVRGAYDYDFGTWVLGGLATYDFSNIAVGGAKLQNLARLGVRVGPDLGSNFVYVTGGAAWAGTAMNSGGDASTSGWFGGIGAEHRLAGGWTLGAELLTNRFADVNDSGNDLAATTATVNVNYRF